MREIDLRLNTLQYLGTSNFKYNLINYIIIKFRSVLKCNKYGVHGRPCIAIVEIFTYKSKSIRNKQDELYKSIYFIFSFVCFCTIKNIRTDNTLKCHNYLIVLFDFDGQYQY